MAAELRTIRTRAKLLGRRQGSQRDQPAAVHPLPNLLLDQLNHEMVEGFMATMDAEERKAFWRNHVDVLKEAFIERGMPSATADAVLADHFQQVRLIHKARTRREAAKARYPIRFDKPPAVGTEVTISGKVATVVAVSPHVRKSDGAASFIITWSIGGRIATSGLHSAGVWYIPEGADEQS